MALVADVVAHVVEQRRVLEPLALAIPEAVHRAQTVEHGECQARDLFRVRLFPAAPLGQFERRAAAHVGNLVHLPDVLAVALDEIEHQTFAQREIAERDVLRFELLEQGVEQQGAGHHQIGAPRIERRNRQALVERRAAHELAHLANRLGRHAQVPHFGWGHAGVKRGRHGAERQDGARCADDAVVAGVDDVPEILVGLLGDVRQHLAFVAAAQRIGRDEAFRQPEHAELEAAREPHLVAGAERDLDTAAADVDDHRRLGRVDAVDGGQMDEPRLLGAGDDARPDAGRVLRWPPAGRRRSRLRGWRSWPRPGSGRPGATWRAARTCRAPAGPRSWPRASASARRGRRRRAAPSPSRDRSPRRRSRGALDHDHVDRVGADVDGGKTHGQVAAIMGVLRRRCRPVPLSMARRTPTSITTLLAPRASALTAVLTAALAGEPEAVHQARVASRRLREVLPVLDRGRRACRARDSARTCGA